MPTSCLDEAALSSRKVPHAIRWTCPAWLTQMFAVDVRALAVLRIGMAVIILYDLAVRAPDLVAHYTDEGVLPRSARMAMMWDYHEAWWMSLHMLSGSAWWQAVLFVLAAAAAVCLLVGYRTKLALLVSGVLLLSLHARFPLLLQGGDVLLRCMIFWSLFLPLDARWSLAARNTVVPRRGEVASLGTAALLIQLSLMYAFSAMLKTDPSWRSDFDAVYYALALDHFTSPLGYWLLDYPWLLKGLTVATFLLEWVGAWLLFLPVGRRFVRIVMPLVFIGFHLGLAATMDLGTFPWICVLYWTVFFPSQAWDWLERVVARLRGKSPSTRGDSELPVRTVGSWVSNVVAAFVLLFVVRLNIKRLDDPFLPISRPPLSCLGKVTGLDQCWNMFCPGPFRCGSWLRLEGELADGRVVNLYRPDESLPDEKPVNVSATYSTQFWRRCLVTMCEYYETPHQDGVLRYFAQQWNAAHCTSEQVTKARLVQMVLPTPPPQDRGPQYGPVERRVVREITIVE